jgi:phage shock protein A
LERKGQAQKLAEQYKSQYEAQSDQVDHLQEALADLETRIAETKAKKELIIAKKNRAQTQETLQQTMSGFGNSNVMDKLDNLEGRVDDRLAQADAMTQLEGGSLENRFRELEKDAEVDSELEELKRKMGMS